jgi:hypothetical protein
VLQQAEGSCQQGGKENEGAAFAGSPERRTAAGAGQCSSSTACKLDLLADVAVSFAAAALGEMPAISAAAVGGSMSASSCGAAFDSTQVYYVGEQVQQPQQQQPQASAQAAAGTASALQQPPQQQQQSQTSAQAAAAAASWCADGASAVPHAGSASMCGAEEERVSSAYVAHIEQLYVECQPLLLCFRDEFECGFA